MNTGKLTLIIVLAGILAFAAGCGASDDRAAGASDPVSGKWSAPEVDYGLTLTLKLNGDQVSGMVKMGATPYNITSGQYKDGKFDVSWRSVRGEESLTGTIQGKVMKGEFKMGGTYSLPFEAKKIE